MSDSCEHDEEHHRPIGVGVDEDGEFVTMECVKCTEHWDDYREWSLGGSDE